MHASIETPHDLIETIRGSSFSFGVMVIRLPKRCAGTTRNGRRCSIESTSNLCGEDGKLLAGPLKDGADCCRVHLDIFCASALAVPDPEPPLLFFIDFETTGLSVTHHQIVEFGVISAHGAVFSTVVKPETASDPAAAAVYGIPDDELQNGPSFCVAFLRFVEFVDKCTRNYALELATRGADEDSLTQSSLGDVEPRLWMIAHNGRLAKIASVQ